jgi:hypothetical protein
MMHTDLPAPRSRAPLVTLAFSTLAVLGGLGCAWLGPPPVSLVVPNLVVLGYALVVLRAAKDGAGVLTAADNTYFLGYLATISALGGLILKVRVDPAALRDPGSLVLSLGIALSSTVVGLVCMTFLKTHAQALEAVTPPPPDVSDALQRLARALEAADLPEKVGVLMNDLRAAPENLLQLRNVANEARTAIAAVTEEARKLANALPLLLERPLHSTVAALTEVQAGAGQLQTAIRGVAQEAALQVQETSSAVKIEITEVSRRLDGLNRTLEEGRTGFERFGASVVQLEQVLEAFVGLVGRQLGQRPADAAEDQP